MYAENKKMIHTFLYGDIKKNDFYFTKNGSPHLFIANNRRMGIDTIGFSSGTFSAKISSDGKYRNPIS
jgi:hypothetical protein